LRDLANPSNPTIKVPMINLGRIVVIGRNQQRRDILRARVEGVAEDDLGYYHVGPTEEGLGQLGRWATVYQPQGEEYAVVAKGCENSAPCFDSPDKVFLLSTAMS
jgi:hypothetical protein